ncbi:PAS domain S-box protein [Chlorogloeopsis sp. ULAP02]|uniref:PAS domain S-box protein n=1 Tax=Chlorogloeopsis sp. ULAP02 TaxID=3107926 RepID=UPI003134EF62
MVHPRRWRQFVRRPVRLKDYGIAIIASGLALLLSLLFSPFIASGTFTLFLASVVFSSLYGGREAGLLATVIGGLASAFFFLAPVLSFSIATLEGSLRLGLFVGVSLLINEMNAARQQAQRNLRTSEARFRRLADSNIIGIIYGWINGAIRDANDGFLQMVGYTREDLRSRQLNWHRMTPPSQQALIDRRIEQLQQNHISLPAKQNLIHRDGTHVPVLMGLALLEETADEVIGFVLDLTALRRTEQALQENYNLLQSVIEGTNDAVFVKDKQGRYLLINTTTAHIIGRSPAEILGKDDTELLPAEEAAVLQENDRRIMTSGRTEVIEEQVTQADRVHTYLSTKDPYRDVEGRVIGLIGVARDITDRKQAEVNIARANQRLEALRAIDRAILRADSTIAIADAALVRLARLIPYQQAAVILFNFATNEAQFLAGQVDGQQAGTVVPIAEMMPLEVLQQREPIQYIEDLGSMLRRSPMLEQQFAQGARSMLRVALLVEGELIGDLNLFANQPAAFTVEHQTIAQEVANQLAIAIQQARLREQLQAYTIELEQRVAERTAALQSANQSLEAFGYSVSHDLQAPLRAMEGLAQALLEDYGEQLDPLGREYAEHIVNSAQQMARLITNLLSYSRLSRTEMNLRPLRLDSVIAEVCDERLASELQERQAQVTVERPLPDVMGHYPTLVQVLTNLITNAVKYMPADRSPQVRIYAEPRGEWVRLWVEDNGIGIDPQYHERIFNVFERLHGEESYPGTGIGLAIVRKGVERMGGRVGVESAAGQGSRFWLELLEHDRTKQQD